MSERASERASTRFSDGAAAAAPIIERFNPIIWLQLKLNDRSLSSLVLTFQIDGLISRCLSDPKADRRNAERQQDKQPPNAHNMRDAGGLAGQLAGSLRRAHLTYEVSDCGLTSFNPIASSSTPFFVGHVFRLQLEELNRDTEKRDNSKARNMEE